MFVCICVSVSVYGSARVFVCICVSVSVYASASLCEGAGVCWCVAVCGWFVCASASVCGVKVWRVYVSVSLYVCGECVCERIAMRMWRVLLVSVSLCVCGGCVC